MPHVSASAFKADKNAAVNLMPHVSASAFKADKKCSSQPHSTRVGELDEADSECCYSCRFVISNIAGPLRWLTLGSQWVSLNAPGACR
jgi:hypothetical protein